MTLAVLLTVAWSAWGGERVVAVGDVEGSYSGLVTILVKSGLLDAGAHWNGGSQVLVQTGNLIGRGGTVRPVLDLMIRLQAEASAQGGRVVVLLGRDEALTLLGLEGEVDPEVCAEFATRGSGRALGQAYAQRRRLWKRRILGPGAEGTTPMPEKKPWLEAHPRGWVEYREAFGPTGEYGRWLRTLPAVTVVGDTLFVHGGIGTAVHGMTLEDMNQAVADELATFWRLRSMMGADDLVPSLASLEEMVAAARLALGQRGGLAADSERDRAFEQLLHARNWLLMSSNGGPLSYPGRADEPDGEAGLATAAALDALGVRRMVVGHTPFQSGHTDVRLGGRAFLIDGAKLSEVCKNGRPGALEIRGETVTAIYPEERVHLAGAAGPSRLTGLSVHPQLLDARARPLPPMSEDGILDLLRTGRVVQYREIGRGINENYKLLLEKDGVQVHAAYRVVDQEAELPVGNDVEMRRKYGGSAMDRAIYEAAAFEMNRILGIDRVSPVVERRVDEIRVRGRAPRSTVQLWLERVTGDRDRRLRGVVPPDAEYEHQQLQTMYLFDNIIGNIDRTQENLLFDRNWKLWFIDHTRSFIKSATLVNPDQPTRCERRVWQRLTSLNEEEVRHRLEPYLEKTEINFVLARWHKVVEMLQARIDAEGEDAVLFDPKDISRCEALSFSKNVAGRLSPERPSFPLRSR